MLIRCLGPVALQHDVGETRLPAAHRHILALLVAAGPDGISVDRLGDEMYGDDITPSWEGAVRKHISRLRPAFEINEIVNRNRRYILNVSTNRVDLWTLLAISELDVDQLSEELIQDLLSGEPFGGVESSPLLNETHEAISIARLQLVQKMAASSDTTWSATTLLEARRLAARSFYRQDLLGAVLELHLAAGTNPNTAEFANESRRFLIEEMGQPPNATIQSLIDATSTQAAGNPTAITESEPITGRILGMFEPAANAGMIGRPGLSRAIQAQLATSGVLVSGDSGSGKSALVQSIVPDLVQAGHHVLWLTGRRGSTSAYQPFLAAVPALEHDLAPLLDDGGNELLRTRCWTAARRRLATEFIDLPLVLVIDDAQWLDSHSQALAVFLSSGHGPASPTLVAIGRDDPSARDWDQFSQDLHGLALQPVEVGEFDQDELLELIGLHQQSATSKQRHDFAATLIEQRAALPAVAHELVRAADPNTLAITDLRAGGDATGVWVTRVRPKTQQVAAAAAVLGLRFRLSAIAELSGLSIDAVADASDELRDTSTWVSEQRPDEFSFRHVLIHADFDAVLDTGDRRRLHLQAARAAQARDDVHASATHLVEAAALVGSEEVVEALLISARQFHARGSYREAVESFAHAQHIADHELGIDDLLGFSYAVSSSGGDGWDLRATAFELALDAGDADRCLDVALHGALRTEDVMGQPRRVAMLERIDSATLTTTHRARHAAALARELGLLGHHDRAIATATEAVSQATTPDDRFAAWLGAWASCRAWPPHMWPPLPNDRHSVSDPELVSRLAQVECGLAMLTGDDDATRTHLRAFADHPATKADPLRTWHVALAQATLSFVDGNWDQARQLANQAFAAASKQGVVAAFSTRIAQEFVLQWVAEQHGALLDQFENAPPDINGSLLARAGHAIALAQHDQHQDRAAIMIGEVAAEAHRHRSPLSPAAAALLASAPTELLSDDTVQTLRHVLDPFRGSALVPGAVLSHLGPASWSLARLANNHDARVELLQQSVDEAKRWNLRLWSVICMRDLAKLTEDNELTNQARRLAAGTELEILL